MASRVVPGSCVDDQTVALDQPVAQRGFADVGAADETDAERLVGGPRLGGLHRRGAESGQNRVAQLHLAHSVLGREEKRLAQAEPVEIGVVAPGVVEIDLVHHEQHRLVLPAQALRDALVERGDAVLRVDHEQDDLGGIDGELHLPLGRGHDLRWSFPRP